MSKNANAIGKYFGSHIYYKEVDADGGTIGTWQDLGYIQEIKINDDTPLEEALDMSGKVVAQQEGERKVKITGLLMQSDKSTLDFVSNGCRGKYYAFYINLGMVDSLTQEFFAAICEVKPQMELASGVKRIPFEVTVLNNESDITGISTTGITDAVATTLSVSADEYYSIVAN